MTRAEERALEAYPHYTAENITEVTNARHFFAKGYEQAEKDLALTWEDIHKLVIIEDKLIYELCIKDDTIPATQSFYEEVLKRFKEAKK